jgi:membrane-anchored protein YejM (alkaline phosphatase superfamily)
VRWFLTRTLTQEFDEFLFWGPRDYANWFALREPHDFALNHHEDLVRAVARHPKWFLFVNCLETHAPYNNGLDAPDEEVRRVIDRGAPIWAGRRRRALDVSLSRDEFHVLHRAQQRAVEVIDERIGRLVEALPRPFVVVCCGDHGEAFGEDGRWGHGFPSPAVQQVPMVVGYVL